MKFMDGETVKVFATNAAAFLFAAVTDVEAVLKCCVLAATFLWTLLKCWQIVKGKKDE